MRRNHLISWFAVAIALAGVLAPQATAQDVRGWLNWRGPDQTGVSRETGLPEKWEVRGENHLWDIELQGRGTPVIANGRVYSWGYRGIEQDLYEVLVCLDEKTGEIVWEKRFHDFLSETPYNRYSIGSPVIDSETGYLYWMSTPGAIFCLTRDGEIRWEHSMLEEFGRNTYPNGRVGAPTIEGDFVIFRGVSNNWGAQAPPRDRVYAFDKRTGEPVWAATAGVGPPLLKDSCFSTPFLDWWEGRRVLYTGLGSGSLVCINAWTGEPIWRSQQIMGGINSSVLIHDGKLVAIHGRQNLDTTETGRMVALKLPGADRLQPGKRPLILNAKDEVWRAPLCMFTSSPVLVGDRVYQVVQTGEIYCVDANTGKQLWHEKLGPTQIHASPLFADGKLYVPMNNGSFWILRPSDSGPEVLAKVQLEGNCLGSPAAWNGKVYVHTTKRLYCFGSADGNADGLPAPPEPVRYAKPGPATRLQIVPNEFLLRPGETQSFRAFALDANGQRVREVKESLTWKMVPGKGGTTFDGAFDASGVLVAGKKISAGVLEATAGTLSGTTRGRLVASVPYVEDFEGFELTMKHPSEEGAKVAPTPMTWVPQIDKWQVWNQDGNQVLAKTAEKLIHHKAISYFGSPEQHSYTYTADVKSDGNRRGLGEVGVVNQRYLIKLMGNHDKIEINSNIERFRHDVDYIIKPKVWYRMKTRVDVNPDGSGVVRAKVWKRDSESEPAEWTIEAKHDVAHKKGSPGVFGFSPQARFRVYVDNIEITPNSTKGSGS